MSDAKPHLGHDWHQLCRTAAATQGHRVIESPVAHGCWTGAREAPRSGLLGLLGGNVVASFPCTSGSSIATASALLQARRTFSPARPCCVPPGHSCIMARVGTHAHPSATLRNRYSPKSLTHVRKSCILRLVGHTPPADPCKSRARIFVFSIEIAGPQAKQFRVAYENRGHTLALTVHLHVRVRHVLELSLPCTLCCAACC